MSLLSILRLNVDWRQSALFLNSRNQRIERAYAGSPERKIGGVIEDSYSCQMDPIVVDPERDIPRVRQVS
jgi:hypothetical protein